MSDLIYELISKEDNHSYKLVIILLWTQTMLHILNRPMVDDARPNE